MSKSGCSVRAALTLADIESMIPPPPESLDPEAAAYVMEFRRSIFMRRIDKVNERYDDFLNVWPTGGPVDFFIGLESCRDDIYFTLSRLSREKVRHAIRAEAGERGFGSRQPHVKLTHTAFFSCNALDSEWSIEEIARFKELYSRVGPDFVRISYQIHGKTPEQCRMVYKKLADRSELPELASRAQDEEDMKKFVLSVSFEHNGRVFEVGGSDALQTRRREVNPLPEMIDKVTGEVMDFPAMSEEGYVLDYFTWMMLLETGRPNPFTGKPIYSKDNFVLLTNANFEQYREQIEKSMSRGLTDEEYEDYDEEEDSWEY